MNYNFSFIK